MRKQRLRILIALIGVAGLGMAARGQAVDQIVLNIPYKFVVAGKTLPAGTYSVKRLRDDDPDVLILTSFETRTNAIVLPTTKVDSSSADKAQVSFEEVGGEHFLSKIETADHVFTIAMSRSEILDATSRSNSGTSASGSSAGN
jgi:hypothetical protein